MTSFAHPAWLWLIALVAPMTGWYIYKVRTAASITVSTTDTFVRRPETAPRARPRPTIRTYLRHLPFALSCVAIVLSAIALARPQSSETGSSSTTRGIDIVLALDISSSMLARDFSPDRIAVAKDVAASFINDRPGDRIGLVVFAAESFTQSPLTTDRATLLTLLAQVETGAIEDGTAIGSGLATALNRLRESDAASKVVILLTDGVNNTGRIAPLTSAEIAKTLDIKVYTIGVGSQGEAPYPARDAWGNTVMVRMPVEIDEQILSDIASQTGGQYFRATDRRSLEAIYAEIDRLETSEIETSEFTRHTELFGPWVLGALLALVLAFLIKILWLRPLP